jgi:hypothetical protein
MNQSQTTLPALLSMPFKPLRLWMIDRALQQSDRNSQVIDMQQQMLREEQRAEHRRQVELKAKKMQIERGL